MAEKKQITTRTVLSYLSSAFTAVAEYILIVKEILFFGGLDENLQAASVVTSGGVDNVVGNITSGYVILIDDSQKFEPINTANGVNSCANYNCRQFLCGVD